jgi:hypothetical protein
MKAVARLFWIYCAGLPVQRWLGVIVLATLPLAILSVPLRTPGLLLFPTLATVCYAFATTMATGYMLRALSAPRAHRFLPRFRGRSLSAFFGVVVAVSVPWSLVFAIMTSQRPPLALVLFPLFMVTAMVLFTFFLRAGLVLIVLSAAFSWAAGRTSEAFLAAGRVPLGAAIDVWIALWVAFAIWYLRVRQIPRWVLPSWTAGGLGSSQGADRLAVFDRHDAVGVYLGANLWGLKQRLVAPVALTACLVALYELIRRRAPGDTAELLMPLLAPAAGALAASGANRIAQRTRRLWLPSGFSRRALFVATEKHVWGTLLATYLIAFVAAPALIAGVYDVPPGALVRGFAGAISGGVLAVYLGLLFVRGIRVAELAVAVLGVASLAIGIRAALGGAAYDRVLVAVVVSQLVGAFAVRMAALASWQRIDWLVFRPIRMPHQSLRAER